MSYDSYATDYTSYHMDTDEHRLANPARLDPLIKAPCDRRPDTGQPCIIHSRGYSKNNTTCAKCSLAGKGGAAKTIGDVYIALLHGLTARSEGNCGKNVEKKIKQRGPKKPNEIANCAWCDAEFKLYSQNQVYCRKCGPLVSNRKIWWSKNREGEPPKEWLHRPRTWRGTNKDYSEG